VTPRLLAFCGSSRSGSFNQTLLDLAVHGALDAGAEVTALRLADYQLPIYDGDWEGEHGLPAAARVLQTLFREHDGLLIATPDYNGGYTALLKNTLDWLSRPDPKLPKAQPVFHCKIAALLSASPGHLGGIRSQQALHGVLHRLGVIVLPEAFALGSAHQAFDDDGELKDVQVDKAVRHVGAALARMATRT